MSMREWAKREVEIACKRENPNRKEGEFDYGCACYESALKAFNSLMEDGHSGFSIGMTKQILNRLIDGRPLTPIEDTDDVWNHIHDNKDDSSKNYQCKRMSSLFKDVYSDGTVKYSDVNRVRAVYVDDPDICWSNGFITKIVQEMFPIKFPYMPESKPYTAVCEEVLTDPKNGDYDTIGILYIKKPDGDDVQVNRYFKEGKSLYGCWDEISFEEYEKRKEMHRNRIENEQG